MPLEARDFAQFFTGGLALVALIVTLRERHNSLRVALFNREADSYEPIMEKLAETQRLVDEALDMIDNRLGGKPLLVVLGSLKDRIPDLEALNRRHHYIQPIQPQIHLTMCFGCLSFCVVTASMYANHPDDEVLRNEALKCFDLYRQGWRGYMTSVQEHLGLDDIRRSRYALHRRNDLPDLEIGRVERMKRELMRQTTEVNANAVARYNEIASERGAKTIPDAPPFPR